MVAPRRDFVVPLFFGPEQGQDQKKGLRRKSSGFLVQKQVKTKNKSKERSLPYNYWFFGSNKVGDHIKFKKNKVFTTNQWS